MEAKNETEVNNSPLVEHNSPYDTIHRVQCVLKYLSTIKPFDAELEEDVYFGEYLLKETLISALDHAKADMRKMGPLRVSKKHNSIKLADF